MITTNEIKAIVNHWAKSLPYKVRIYLYGSYIKGNKKEPSDIDIAVELCDDQLPDEPELLWHDNHEIWESYLSKEFGMKADLELYITGTRIPSFVADGGALIYDGFEKEDKNESKV